MPADIVPVTQVPNRGNRGLLGLTDAEKTEVEQRTLDVRADKDKAKAAGGEPDRTVREPRLYRVWPASGHYTRPRS
jgi:hypothetical protein